VSPALGDSTPRTDRLAELWENLSHAGLAETALRLGTHVLVIAVILLVAWGLRDLYMLVAEAGSAKGSPSEEEWSDIFSLAQPAQPTETPIDLLIDLSTLVRSDAVPGGTPLLASPNQGVRRLARLHTDVPSRPREEVLHYTVKSGDTLFGIADKFGLKPETILWANQYVLADNPHNLRPGQELNILPVDGAYHRWSAGDGLNGVAKFFGVEPEAIIQYPGNHLNPDTLGDWSHPNIEPDTWLIIPGGRRAFVSWSAPVIPLDDPGVAKVLGPGACESVSGGVVGVGVFVWPADNHFLSGFDYEPDANHPGIDIDGDEGAPVYAADNGVVVYAGWNNWGYGNVIVINHVNGWQTLYAHLSAYYVTCGQNVYQGNTIGAIGATGNADGAHLHFEMMYNGVRVNPHDYLH
jgi:murein DD-endopeptidase MepM/ murein hydrolase activator NlpD